MAKKKNTHGGARPGAGRKSKYKLPGEKENPETATISIRHRKDVIDEVKAKYPEKGEITRLGQEWLESLLK